MFNVNQSLALTAVTTHYTRQTHTRSTCGCILEMHAFQTLSEPISFPGTQVTTHGKKLAPHTPAMQVRTEDLPPKVPEVGI